MFAFGLAKLTVSQPLLRRWVLLPLAKRDVIRRRHEAVELFVRNESSAEVMEIRARLAELGGLPQLCFLLNMGVGTASTWHKLLKVGLQYRRGTEDDGDQHNKFDSGLPLPLCSDL